MVESSWPQGNRDYFESFQSSTDVENHVFGNENGYLTATQPIENTMSEGAVNYTFDSFGHNFAPPSSSNTRSSITRSDQPALRQIPTLDISLSHIEPESSLGPDHTISMEPPSVIRNSHSLSEIKGKKKRSTSPLNRTLPKKKRGGRRGKAREVCIKCSLNRVKVSRSALYVY